VPDLEDAYFAAIAALTQEEVDTIWAYVRANRVGAETLESILQWGDETFGPAKPDRVIERGWEEWQEMIAPGADVTIEAADVIIVLLRMPGILEALERKMEINRARRWRLMGDGTGYHIKGVDSP
jgi:hypothetical protein